MADSSYTQDAEFFIEKAPGASEDLARYYIELAKANALVSIAQSLETVANYVRYRES